MMPMCSPLKRVFAMLQTLPNPSSLKQQAYTVSQSFWESGVILIQGLSWSSCQNVVWGCNWVGPYGPSWDRSHPHIFCCSSSLKYPDNSVCMCAKLLQSCLTDPMDHSLWGSSVRGTLLARLLVWIAALSSRGTFQCRDQIQSLYLYVPWQASYLPLALPGKPTQIVVSHAYSLSFLDAKTTTEWKK